MSDQKNYETTGQRLWREARDVDVSEFVGKKYFRIHKNDAGTEAHSDQYVKWLEKEIKQLRKQLEVQSTESHRISVAMGVKNPVTSYEKWAYAKIEQLRKGSRNT